MKIKKEVQPETKAPAGEYRNFPQVPLMARPIPAPKAKRAEEDKAAEEQQSIPPEA